EGGSPEQRHENQADPEHSIHLLFPGKEPGDLEYRRDNRERRREEDGILGNRSIGRDVAAAAFVAAGELVGGEKYDDREKIEEKLHCLRFPESARAGTILHHG